MKTISNEDVQAAVWEIASLRYLFVRNRLTRRILGSLLVRTPPITTKRRRTRNVAAFLRSPSSPRVAPRRLYLTTSMHILQNLLSHWNDCCVGDLRSGSSPWPGWKATYF